MNMTQGGRASGRDVTWFEGFYAQHYQAVYAFCCRRAPQAAEDITAEVFATVWARRDDVPHDAVPWTFGVAHNKLKNDARTRGRRAKLDARIAAEPHVGVNDPGATVTDKLSRQSEVAKILDTLDAKDAEILRLWAWEELDSPGIATVLGISHVAARARLSRARKRAAKIAARHGHGNVITLYSAQGGGVHIMDQLRQSLGDGNPMPTHKAPQPPPGGVQNVMALAEHTKHTTSGDQLAERRGRRRQLLVAAAIVPLVAAGTGFGYLLSQNKTSDNVHVADTGPTTAPVTGDKSVTLKGHTITVKGFDIPQDGVLAIISTSDHQIGPDTTERSSMARFYSRTDASYVASFFVPEGVGSTVDALFAEADPRMVSKEPAGHLPTSASSVSAEAWSALARGEKPKSDHVSYDVDSPQWPKRLFDYAAYELQGSMQTVATRIDVINALENQDLDVEPVDVDGKPMLKLTSTYKLPTDHPNAPRPGEPLSPPTSFLIDPATGTSPNPSQTVTRTELDAMPQKVIDLFEQWSTDAEKNCQEYKNKTVCT